MATLHLRNVPQEIDALLTDAAAAGGTSKNRLAVEALRRGLGLDQFDRAAVISQVRATRPVVDVDVAALLRADRPGGDD